MALADEPLDAWDDDGETEERSRFRVHDPASAEWALRKIARARQWFAGQQALFDAESSRLREHLNREQARLDDDEQFFGALLEDWHRQVLDDDPQRKTIALPSGRLKARKAPDRVEVADPDAFVCAQGLDSTLVRVTAKPDLAAIKKATAADGELVDGVAVIPGEVRFTVETAPPVTAEPGDAF